MKWTVLKSKEKNFFTHIISTFYSWGWLLLIALWFSKQYDKVSGYAKIHIESNLEFVVMSISLRPHGWQQANLPSPSLPHYLPEFAQSCPLSWWCYLIISSSVTPFSFCLQSLPGLKSFPISPLFPPGGQSIRVSASASVLPMNIQGLFPLGLTGLQSLQSRDSQKSSPAPQFESITSSVLSLLHDSTVISIHDHWKKHSFD